MHVRTCRGTQPKTCIKHMTTGSITTHPNLRIMRPSDSRDIEKVCALVDASNHGHLTTYQISTTIGLAVTGLQQDKFL